MLHRKYLFGQITILCIISIAVILLINQNYNLLPINTVFILLYLVLTLFVTIWTGFVLLEDVLNQKKTINVGEYYLIKKLLKQQLIARSNPNARIKYTNERIESFVSAIEQEFVWKWYMTYVSSEGHFLKETHHLLVVVVKLILQITEQLDSDKLIHGGLLIVLKHVKEHKKAARKCKGGGSSLDEHFRYTHIASNNQDAFVHLTHQLTAKLLRYFINWELYNSVACQCLISILAKRIISYIVNVTSSPAYVNMHIMMALTGNYNQQLISLSDDSRSNQIMQQAKAVDKEAIIHKVIPEDTHCEDIQEMVMEASVIRSIAPEIVLRKSGGRMHLSGLRQSADELVDDGGVWFAKKELPACIIVPPATDAVDSPEPEYEENPDLATTAAKLRSLLALRTIESESSNVPTPAASPAASLCMTPLDPSGSSIEYLMDEVDDGGGAMPSMYKAWGGWARTATGVFQNTIKNTMKTVSLEQQQDASLGSNSSGDGDSCNVQQSPMIQFQTASPPTQFPLRSFSYAIEDEDANEDCFAAHVRRLLGERRIFCTVIADDNAYEALDHCQSLHISNQDVQASSEERDHFDMTMPMTKALVDLLCELLVEEADDDDAYEDGGGYHRHHALAKENVVRFGLLTAGTLIEDQLHQFGQTLVQTMYDGMDAEWLRHPFTQKQQPPPPPLAMKLKTMVDICMESVPALFRSVVGEQSTKALTNLLLESLQSPRINQDMCLQFLELIVSEVIRAADLQLST